MSAENIITLVTRVHVPSCPNLNLHYIRQRDMNDRRAEAATIKFACENPTHPAVIGRIKHDPHLRAIVEAHLAKKAADSAPQESKA